MNITSTPWILVSLLASSSVFAACNEDAVKPSEASRFVLNAGEAYDQQTKLTWSRCSAGTRWTEGAGCAGEVALLRLDEAKQFAQEMGGGWRLPSIVELHSIVEPQCANPALDATVFPGVTHFEEGAPYWSDTHFEEMPSLIYFIDFVDGAVDAHSEGFALAVRLVRDE